MVPGPMCPARFSYRCSRCGVVTPDDGGLRYACADCGDEALDIELDLSAGKMARDELSPREPSLWRYAPLLPVTLPHDERGPLRSVGGTALHRVGPRLWLKDDGLLPTGSLKDRASAIVTQRAVDLGLGAIITASTGNAGVATAAMAACAGMRAIVLVPDSAPPAKIAQLLIYGAELYLVRGNYDAAFALAKQAASTHGWYCRNTAYNPFTVEGKKTVAFEICEQLDWHAPDRIYVSMGDGNIISGVHKGLRDLLDLGWIDQMPKLFGVQARGSAAIANAFAAGADVIAPVAASTIADSIAADMPADGLRALRAVRDSDGGCVMVSDDEILTAMATLGNSHGVFAEPAAAAAYAGYAKDHSDAERAVVLITGNGLKDVAAAQRATTQAPCIEPTIDSLDEAIAARDQA